MASLRPRVKRVCLKDVLFLLEQERSSSRSTLLYKAFLKWWRWSCFVLRFVADDLLCVTVANYLANHVAIQSVCRFSHIKLSWMFFIKVPWIYWMQYSWFLKPLVFSHLCYVLFAWDHWIHTTKGQCGLILHDVGHINWGKAQAHLTQIKKNSLRHQVT